MLPEVRMARVLDAIVSHRAGRLSCVEAGELLGLSERHFRRLRDAYEDRGEEGLVDRRRGSPHELSCRAALLEIVAALTLKLRPTERNVSLSE
jgi:transposase